MSEVNNPNLIPWLRSLAEKGGKGGVDNVDGRSLGRVADALESLLAECSGLRAALTHIKEVAAQNGEDCSYLIADMAIGRASNREPQIVPDDNWNDPKNWRPHDEYCERYSTREEAEKGHEVACELVRSAEARDD